MMPFTIPEALEDLPEGLALVNKIATSIKALPAPPTPRKASDYAAIVVACAPDLAALIDKVEEQVKS
jgi:hypothetical protein